MVSVSALHCLFTLRCRWDPTYAWYRNDIESVSVRAGCVFTGFDDSRCCA